MSYMDFMKVINNLGYVRIKCMWYHHPEFSFECELRPLNNDANVLKFVEDMNNMRRASGRPKKKRDMANDEPTSSNLLPKFLTTIKCKNCGILGYNSRTCKGKTTENRQLAKGSNKVTKAKKQRKASTKDSATVLTQ